MGTGVLRRVGAIGDVHGEDVLLEAAIHFLEHEGRVDATLCVGDIVDGQGNVDRCGTLLRNHGVQTVAGNHDRWFLANEQRGLPDATREVRPNTWAWLESLPRTRRFRTAAGTLLLCHGVGENDMAELRPETRGYGLQALHELRALWLDPEVDLVVGGHTHARMVRPFPGLVFINAGTLHREHGPGFVMLDFAARKVELYDLPAPPRHGGNAPRLAEVVPLPEPLPLR